MDQVIAHLQCWKTELSIQTGFNSIEEKANHIGLVNSIEVAIKQLELCRTYGINPGSWVCVFPEEVPGYSQPMFRVVCDGEGNDPAGWKELSFAGRGKVRFHGGDLAIKR
ncbi:hypothetical protein BH09VER1_BH09VER1_29060 [soil metagenome]